MFDVRLPWRHIGIMTADFWFPSSDNAQYTGPTRRRVGGVYTFATSWWSTVSSLDESEQICKQRSRVASCRRCSVNTPVGSRDSVYNFLGCWAIEVGDKWRQCDIMTSLLKETSISIKIHVIKPLARPMFSFQIVDRICRQSSWASCELCSHGRRRCVLGFKLTIIVSRRVVMWFCLSICPQLVLLFRSVDFIKVGV